MGDKALRGCRMAATVIWMVFREGTSHLFRWKVMVQAEKS